MVNDQKGLETDKKVELVRSFGVPVVVMHSLTVPTDRNINLDRIHGKPFCIQANRRASWVCWI